MHPIQMSAVVSKLNSRFNEKCVVWKNIESTVIHKSFYKTSKVKFLYKGDELFVI